jgi:adenylosuccinate lyase
MRLIADLRGKGLKGAVGTQASYQQILKGTEMNAQEMEAVAMKALELPYYPISTQTYTRQQDLRVQQTLAGIAASLHKFTLDFRILQSPVIGEWAEPFGKKQVGSTAMPFKRNPIGSENVCSLARYVAALPAVAWDNASQAILERSLDDSANRRLVQAEGFLAVDEIVSRTTRIVREMTIDERAIRRNMIQYGPFAATERVLMALVTAGAGRQEAHEWLRLLSLQAWEIMQAGNENPLLRLLEGDEQVTNYLTIPQLRDLTDSSTHTGTAALRAAAFAKTVRKTLKEYPSPGMQGE